MGFLHDVTVVMLNCHSLNQCHADDETVLSSIGLAVIIATGHPIALTPSNTVCGVGGRALYNTDQDDLYVSACGKLLVDGGESDGIACKYPLNSSPAPATTLMILSRHCRWAARPR